MIYDIKWNDTMIKDFKTTNDKDLGEVHDKANGPTLFQMGAIGKENLPFPKPNTKL